MNTRRLCACILVLMAVVVAGIMAWPAVALAQDEWEWQHPLPQGNYLSGVWGSSATNVFAVGERGTILHYDGTSWTPMSSGTTAMLHRVWGSSGSNVFAVGDAGIVLHYDGVSWSVMSSGTTDPLRDVWGAGGNNVIAVGGSGTILHYNGASWSPMASGTTTWLNGVWGRSGSDVFAVGNSGTILHYDGTTWSPLSSGTSESITGIWGSGATVFAITGGWSSPVLRYDGTNWTSIGNFGPASDIEGSSATDVFVVGYGGISHYDGTNWTFMPSSAGAGVWVANSSSVFAVGGTGTILHYDGANWNSMTTIVTSEPLQSVWGSSGSDVFAVGGSGTILHFDGTSWSAMNSGGSDYLSGVWGSSGDDVFVVGWDGVGNSGAILHYDGTNWGSMNSGTEKWLRAVWGSSSHDVFAVGTGGTILHYDGVQWSPMSSGTIEDLNGIWGRSASDVFAVGNDHDYGRILHYDGQSWSGMSLPNDLIGGFNGVWGSSGTDVYAVATPDVLHYDGVNWEYAGIPRSWSDYNFTAVWGSGGNDVFVTGNAYGWPPPPDNLDNMWHYDGTAWAAIPFPTGAPSAGWANSETDVFAVGGISILHYAGPPPQQLLTVTKAGIGTGTVTSNPGGINCGAACSALFKAGQVVTLTATTDAFSTFTGWSGACAEAGPCILTMDAHKAVTATFTLQTFPLTVSKAGIGSGTVASNPAGITCGTTCSATFTAGTVVTLTATPDSGASFSGWSGACLGTGSCPITMNSAQAVTATFGVPGAVMPQASTMYYGQQLQVGGVVAAAAPVTVTKLVVFTGTVPAGIFLVGVEGSEPYAGEVSAGRLINRLLKEGCGAHGACTAVNVAVYAPDGGHTDFVATSPVMTENLYLPLVKRQ